MCSTINKIFSICIELVVALMLYILLLMPAILLDYFILGRISFSIPNDFYENICNVGRFLGLNYKKTGYFLNRNFGSLLTVMSGMVTIGVHIVTRSGNKIYGVPRLMWQHNAGKNFYRLLTRIAFLSPAALFWAINASNCATGCLILIYDLVFFGISFFVLNESFITGRDRDLVAKKLVKAVKGTKDVHSEDIQLVEYLENISLESLKPENQISIRLLFERVLEEAKDESFKDYFICCYSYYHRVYMINGNAKKGIELIKNILYKWDQLDEKRMMALWAMTCSIFGDSDNATINEFVEWCVAIPKTRCEIDMFSKHITYRCFIVLVGMIMFNIECQYEVRKFLLNNWRTHIAIIYKYGQEILTDEYTDLRKQMKCVCAFLDSEQRQYMRGTIEKLECLNGNNEMFDASIIINMLKCI